MAAVFIFYKKKNIMKTLPLESAHYLYWLQSYEQWLQIIGYSESAIKNWPANVRELLHFLESRHIHHITLIDNQHINQFIGHVKQRMNTARDGALSSSSINTIINAVNSFSSYLNSTGKLILDYTIERAEEDVKMPTVLCIQEIKSMYDVTFLPQRENSLAMGQRDRVIIAIFYGCGLRKMEGTLLNLDDIDLNKKLLFVRKGKGGKQRYVPIASKHAEDIKSYITEGREWFLHAHYARDYTSKHTKRKKASDDGAFFLSQQGGRLTEFYPRLEYLKEKAGIEKQFSLHSLRHSIATHLLQSGMPIEEIARFLGHSTIDSTQIYTHLTITINHNPDG
jgi:integrase/recombinase XerD